MWKAVKYILTYFGFEVLVALIIMVPASFLDADTPEMIVLTLAVSNLLFCWYITRKGRIHLGKESFTIRPWSILLLSVVALFFFILPELELVERLDLPDDIGDDLYEVGGTLLGLVSIGIIGPIGEELLFRGVVLGSLLEWKPLRPMPWLAVLLSAAIFSLIHLNPAQMPGAFMMGLLFSWIVYRTGSLLPGIIGHIFNNSLSCIMIMLSDEESADETVAEMFNSPVLEFLAVAGSFFLCVVAVRALVRKVNENYPPGKFNSVPEDIACQE